MELTESILKKSQSNLIVIAEIGVNHEGCFDKAKELLHLAANAGADIVKFQSYTPSRYASASDTARLQRVTNFSLNEKNFSELSQFAASINVEFLSTPVTEDWVEKLNPFVKAFKIASGDITFKPVLQEAARTGKPVIISTGAATIEEIDQAVEWLKDVIGSKPLNEQLILMHCVAAYPVPIEQANLLSIPFLQDRYKVDVGYSNHVIGMDACLAAAALGASVIEVHFTDQKEGREFRDHALSFDQDDLKLFIEKARNIKNALGIYGKNIQPCEKDMIPLIRKGIIAARNLSKGDIIKKEDLMFARPATEFNSNDIDFLIGKIIKKDVPIGYLIPKDAI